MEIDKSRPDEETGKTYEEMYLDCWRVYSRMYGRKEEYPADSMAITFIDPKLVEAFVGIEDCDDPYATIKAMWIEMRDAGDFDRLTA
jgi:hypothetical protein